ncbi:SseB family protein [Sinomonas sp. JGH33]|uniref:SseB family protein n=1 Tax=Sinomonas terricola TaxID=3110330 RepID=A0ABU5T4D8_9MICC|nr:SseB family protein [Sinomonas sp. JGH33]MEA5454531.1 SseB family protein [Sinomonas sp. JGH33]
MGAPRHLPGHIAAALARAGEPSDSAGRPWAGRDLAGEGNPLHQFDADDGAADPGVEAALAALASGGPRERAAAGSEEAVVAALATARVFVPVVASLAEGALGEHGFEEDKEADMALVTLSAPDGRKALPVFTSVERLEAWHAAARPVAVATPRAALSAVSEGAELVVVDPGADVTFVLRRPAVWALAQQKPWTPSYRDESLVDVVAEALEGLDAARAARLEPGRGVATRDRLGRILTGGGHGPELRIVLELEHGLPADAVRDIVAELNGRLAASERFAEAVDSIEISLRAAGT